MQLAGSIELKAQAAGQQLVADLRDGRYRFKLDARRQGDQIELRDVAVQAGAGRLNAHGTLSLADPNRFALAGKLADFNPAEFGAYPAAKLNASFSGQGLLAPQPQASVKFEIADSRLRSAPLAGQGSLSLSADRLWDVAVKLNLARSRLTASGALGGARDSLEFDLDVDSLAAIDRRSVEKGASRERWKASLRRPQDNSTCRPAICPGRQTIRSIAWPICAPRPRWARVSTGYCTSNPRYADW
jgi:translocation and assembly module TamB